MIIDCRPEVCQACGASLSGVEGECIGSQEVLELPLIKAVVIELRLYRTRCACGACEEGQYPAGYQDIQQDFGPGVQALVQYGTVKGLKTLVYRTIAPSETVG